MLDKLQEEVAAEIKKADEAGQLSGEKLEKVMADTVAAASRNAAGEELDSGDTAREAITAATQELKRLGKATRANIEAVVTGTLRGINHRTREAINHLDLELLKTRQRLEEQQEKFAAQLQEALKGARAAAAAFSAETRKKMEAAVVEARLKSAEILGLMEETIKQSVTTVIEEGRDIEEKVAQITKTATENALNEVRLSTQKVKKVSEAAVLAAVEAAQEAGKEIRETTRGAIEGTRQGLAASIEKAREKLVTAKDKTARMAEEDIRETIKNFKTVERNFIAALGDVADKVGATARDVLQENIASMKKTTSRLRDSAEEAVDSAIEYFKTKGPQAIGSARDKALKATEIAREEVGEVAEKMVKIAKGAFSGMVAGAKKALQDEDEER